MAKIVIIAPHFWPEKIGSAPYCTDLAVWLADRGHDVIALSFRPHYPSTAEFMDWHDGSRDAEKIGRVTIHRVPTQGRRGGTLGSRARNDIGFLLKVCRSAFNKDFSAADAIFAFVPNTLSLFGARLLAARSGARLIGVVHDIESGLAGALGFTSTNLVLSAIRLVERVAMNRPDEIVVLTNGMQKELRRLKCERPIRVLPLWCGPPAADAAEASGNFVIAYSGNFGKKQSLDQLLPFFQQLQDKLPDARVHLRGDGSERDGLERSIVSMGLGNTTFHPLVDADLLLGTIQSADLHLVPQAPGIGNYAIPSKVYTIMSAGRPFVCIAEDGTELAALARESGAGVCVEPNNPAALFSAVERLFNDRAALRRMGEDARRYVGARLDRVRILEEYEKLIEPVSVLRLGPGTKLKMDP